MNRRGDNENLYTVIDTKNLDKLIDYKYTWSASYMPFIKSFYAQVTIYQGINDDEENPKKKISLHYFLMNPNNLKGVHIDHINHNTLDNRECNLRVSRISDNLENRKSKNSNNKSGYRNVFWNTAKKKWSVSLCKNYKRIDLGDYDDVDEAGKVAEAGRQKYYGKFAGKN